MKKIFLVLLLFTLFLLVGCSKSSSEKLVVYNWGEYIDPAVVEEFEKETGIDVVYETFEQNEDMYTKLKEGGAVCDIVVPSDYMIERMIKEEMIQPIDRNKLENIKNLDEHFLTTGFDKEGKYSIPYLWGTVGILYNKTMVDEPVQSWDILWNPKYENKIIMMNSVRDSIGIALKKLGYSMNEQSREKLEQAKQELIKQKPLVLAYLVDEMKGQMANDEAALAPAYTGDAIVAISNNPNLDYVIPKEGSNIWIDAMVIPKNANNVEAAYKFIDHILKPEVSKKIAEFVGYPIPNKAGKSLLPKETQENKIIYPDLDSLNSMEYFKDNHDLIDVLDSIWAEVKAH